MRFIHIFQTCLLLALSSHLMFSQDGRETQIVKESINDFKIQRTSTGSLIPYLHGVDLEIKSMGSMEEPGKKTIILKVYSESWYLDPKEPGTFFIKDLRGFIRTTPGAISIVDTPSILLIQSEGRRKVAYEGRSFSNKDLELDQVISEGQIDLQQWNEVNATSILPFQLPVYSDNASKIRALEILIPIEIRDKACQIEFVLEHIELGAFIEKSEKFGNPFLENRMYLIKEGSPRVPEKYVPPIPTRIQFNRNDNAQSEATWGLVGSLNKEADRQQIQFVLSHSSKTSTFTGITGIQMLLLTPDGAISIEGMPDIKYSGSNTFFCPDSLSKIILPAGDSLIYPILHRKATKAGLIQSGFDEITEEKSLSYKELLYSIWTTESTKDFSPFPLYASRKNYPITEGEGKLLMNLPVQLFSNPFDNMSVHLKIQFLEGSEKTKLRKREAVLHFTSK